MPRGYGGVDGSNRYPSRRDVRTGDTISDSDIFKHLF